MDLVTKSLGVLEDKVAGSRTPVAADDLATTVFSISPASEFFGLFARRIDQELEKSHKVVKVKKGWVSQKVAVGFRISDLARRSESLRLQLLQAAQAKNLSHEYTNLWQMQGVIPMVQKGSADERLNNLANAVTQLEISQQAISTSLVAEKESIIGKLRSELTRTKGELMRLKQTPNTVNVESSDLKDALREKDELLYACQSRLDQILDRERRKRVLIQLGGIALVVMSGKER